VARPGAGFEPRRGHGKSGEKLGLVGPKVNSGGAEQRRTLRMIRTLENFERFPGDCEILESGGLDDRFELCFQQAACNSPGP